MSSVKIDTIIEGESKLLMIKIFNESMENPENKRLAKNIAWYKKLFKSSINPLNGVIMLLIPLVLIEAIGIVIYDKVVDYMREKGISEVLISIVDILFNEWNILFLFVLILFLGIVIIIRFSELGNKNNKETHTHTYLIRELESKNKNIEKLEKKLESSSSMEVALLLSKQIDQLQQEKKEFEEKYYYLEDILKKYSDIKVVNKVKNILKEKGVDQALLYMESIDFNSDEKRNQENAKALLIQADLYDIKNAHHKAKDTYLKSIRFYREFTNSFSYIRYLDKQHSYNEAQKQLHIMELELVMKQDEKLSCLGTLANIYSKNHFFKEAEEAYNEALTLYRALAKTNPNAYNPDVAMTLNNLAILYRANNRLKESEEAYTEALTLRRALVKTNPNAYGIDCARMLIMGYDLFDMGIENLDEAENLLSIYTNVYEVENWKSTIIKLRGRE